MWDSHHTARQGTCSDGEMIQTRCKRGNVNVDGEFLSQVKNVPDLEVTDWLEFVPDRWENQRRNRMRDVRIENDINLGYVCWGLQMRPWYTQKSLEQLVMPPRSQTSRWRRFISECHRNWCTSAAVQAAGRPAIPHQMWEAAAAWLESSGLLGWRYQADRYANADASIVHNVCGMTCAIDLFSFYVKVKWYQDNPDFWSDTSKDEGPVRGELEEVTTPAGSVHYLMEQ